MPCRASRLAVTMATIIVTISGNDASRLKSPGRPSRARSAGALPGAGGASAPLDWTDVYVAVAK